MAASDCGVERLPLASRRLTPFAEGRPKPPPPDDPKQSRRFIDAAKEAGVDETGEAFERAITRVIGKERKPTRS